MAMAGGVRLFVYYRVPLAQLPALVDLVTAMQAELRRSLPGLTAELMRRPGAADGLVMLMEVYRHPAGADDAVEAAVNAAAAGLSGLIAGQRQTERFVPLQA